MSTLRIKNIHTLTDFVRNAKSFSEQIQKDKEPVGLTVNGRVRLIVIDAEAYEQQNAEHEDFMKAMREGHEDIMAGRTRPASEFFAEFEKKNGL